METSPSRLCRLPFPVGGVALLGIVCQDVGITVRHNIFHVKNVIFKKRLHSQSNILQDVSDCAAVDFRLIPVTHMDTHDQKNAGLKRKEFIMKCSAVVCQCLPHRRKDNGFPRGKSL